MSELKIAAREQEIAGFEDEIAAIFVAAVTLFADPSQASPKAPASAWTRAARIGALAGPDEQPSPSASSSLSNWKLSGRQRG